MDGGIVDALTSVQVQLAQIEGIRMLRHNLECLFRYLLAVPETEYLQLV